MEDSLVLLLPKNQTLSKCGGAGHEGGSVRLLHLSVSLEPPEFGISKRKLAQRKQGKSWIYSQVNILLRLTESPFPGSSLKLAFG